MAIINALQSATNLKSVTSRTNNNVKSGDSGFIKIYMGLTEYSLIYGWVSSV